MCASNGRLNRKPWGAKSSVGAWRHQSLRSKTLSDDKKNGRFVCGFCKNHFLYFDFLQKMSIEGTSDFRVTNNNFLS